jgi:hypothetical protein
MVHVIRAATAADEVSVIDLLTLAFAADPVVGWVWPDPAVYFLAFAR